MARFNAGVRSGDWGPMLELFADDAVLEFVGVPAGPFRGRAEIEAAYRERPPDDEIELLGGREEGDTAVGRYAWRGDGATGELRLSHDGAVVTRLVVAFD